MNIAEQYQQLLSTGQAVRQTVQGAQNVYRNAFAQKPARMPPPRNNPYAGQYYDDPEGEEAGQEHSVPMRPPQPTYKVDEAHLRKRARLTAATHMKYLESLTRFTRTLVGGMAASNAMVELVQRLEAGDETLQGEELDMAKSMRKAVEQRRSIEEARVKILSDDEMREIYEESLFIDLKDQNDKGELERLNPNKFLIDYTILSLAEIAESGKEVIGEKVSGAFHHVTKTFKK